MRLGLSAGLLALAGALLLAGLGAPDIARSLSCPTTAGPPPPAARVFSVELRSSAAALPAPGNVDLIGRYSWAVCTGPGPAVILEARAADGVFAPAGGVAIYRRGTPFTCTPPPSRPPTPVACGIAWGTEELIYAAKPAETTEFRLRAGPLTSETVTVNVESPRPHERCGETLPAQAKPEFRVTPERTRIVFGERIRLRGTFGFRLCGQLLSPSARPAIESLRSGDRFPNQPARHLLAGPVREPNGTLVYEVAPPETTGYRLHFAGDFGQFTTIEVAPKLELTRGRARNGRVPVAVQAEATRSLQGTTVTLERRNGATWKTLRTLTLDEDLVAFTRIAVTGTIELRARVQATTHYAAAVSDPLLVRR